MFIPAIEIIYTITFFKGWASSDHVITKNAQTWWRERGRLHKVVHDGKMWQFKTARQMVLRSSNHKAQPCWNLKNAQSISREYYRDSRQHKFRTWCATTQSRKKKKLAFSGTH